MRRPGPDDWMKLVSEYATSGLQQKDFCAKHDVSLNTLHYWPSGEILIELLIRMWAISPRSTSA